MLVRVSRLIEWIHIHIGRTARSQNAWPILLDEFLALLCVDVVYASRALELQTKKKLSARITSFGSKCTHLEAPLDKVMSCHNKIELQHGGLQMLGQVTLYVIDPQVIWWHLGECL